MEDIAMKQELRIFLNNDPYMVRDIREKLKENGGYCPCKLIVAYLQVKINRVAFFLQREFLPPFFAVFPAERGGFLRFVYNVQFIPQVFSW